jgi:hypothetical protein
MSIANYLTALDAQRDQLAQNLVAMGVQASESVKHLKGHSPLNQAINHIR